MTTLTSPINSARSDVLSATMETKEFLTCRGLQKLIEKKADEIPNAVAVSFPEKSNEAHRNEINYHDLNSRANQLARYLRRSGVGPDVVVGICFERSLEMIVAVLGVIKADGAYVPLDPTYPKERLSFMLEDTKAPIILTQEKLASGLPKNSAHLLCLDTDWKTIAKESGENLETIVDHENLAYLIYTSGSTGKPKGVAMRQGALINLLFWQLKNWSARSDATTLQFASLNFDVSFQEIFATFASGGTLVLISEELRRDSIRLVKFLQDQKIERLFLPFVALKHLANAAEQEQIFPRTLREVITAGEQLQITPTIVKFFSELPDCALHNQYGPSETHVVTAFKLEGPPQSWPALPSIGKPIANTEIYLLDQQFQRVRNGDPGELFIGGECLARGYLNRPELTAEKFIPNPLAPGSRLYKTGDVARYLPDGNIEFLGRSDHQVKIRGFRIELGEIETLLAQHPSVREAIVTAREVTAGDKQLVAYVVPQPTMTLNSRELRNFLSEKVPSYAVPSLFVHLPRLPLTPNGKVDRRALLEPQQVEEHSSAPIKPPQTPLEMQLQLIFERFLKRRPIGIDVSFFELGGDSLQALGLIVEIERFTGKKFPLEILYQASTIESLAKAIQNSSGDFIFSSMVSLQPLGTKPPLFLVHTTPGDVLAYGGLIYHLGLDQPCYGFQSRGFGRAEESHTRVEDMAAYYVKQMRSHQPQGPYYLGGWCYGGIVAVEMGHQLIAAGEKIALMALIETPAPAPPLFSNFSYYGRRISCLLKMNPRQWRKYLGEKIKYYRGVKMANEMRFRRVEKTEETSKVEEANSRLAKLEHVYHTNLDALNFYNVRPYPNKIILFNAAEQDPAQVTDPLYGWPSLAGEIETHTISGNHDTILMEPHVKSLAGKLADCLVHAQVL
ncbi:MAG: amino acid adenylation domain-containing protein [Verrucomicrobiota bacterium]